MVPCRLLRRLKISDRPEFGPSGGGNPRVRRQRHRDSATLLPSRSCDQIRTQNQRDRGLDRTNRRPVSDPPPVRDPTTINSPIGRVTYTGGYVLPGDTPDAGQTPLPD